MTQIERLTLDRMIAANPNINLLISRLDLDLQQRTEAETLSLKVSNRVDNILAELQYSPVVERSVYHEPEQSRVFWTSTQIKEWITKTNFSL